ncbi:cytochrome P450 [Aspergillus aurantiobrunneus]
MVACAVALVLTLGAATLLHLLYNYSRLKSIPGPILAAVSDLWNSNAHRSSGYGRRLAELHRKYGDVVRLGPLLVSLRNAGEIESIYRVRIMDELTRHDREDRLSDDQAVSRFEGTIDDDVRNIIRTIWPLRNADFNMALRFFADEIVARFFRSAHPAECNAQRTHPNSSLFAMMEEMLLRGPTSRLKRARFSCFGLSGDVSPPAYGQGPALRRGPGAYTDTEHVSHGSSVLGTGIEIVTRTFVSAFLFLLNDSRVLRRLRNGIESMPRFHNRVTTINARDLEGIPYLDAVLMETMRLVLLRNYPEGIKVATGPLDVSSKRIPRGTVVSWHPYVLLYDASIYGIDLDTFRPERWLTMDRQQRALMEACLFPFLLCMAYYPEFEATWLQMKKAIVIQLRGFDEIVASDARAE